VVERRLIYGLRTIEDINKIEPLLVTIIFDCDKVSRFSSDVTRNCVNPKTEGLLFIESVL
jgi:hypothetical protein